MKTSQTNRIVDPGTLMPFDPNAGSIYNPLSDRRIILPGDPDWPGGDLWPGIPKEPISNPPPPPPRPAPDPSIWWG